MPVVNLELNAKPDTVGQPIVWRLARLFNVVTNVRRARVSEDYGYILLEMEGSPLEIEQASGYLASLGVVKADSASSAVPGRPEEAVLQPNTIYVRLSSVSAEQGQVPALYRIGKDFNVVVNIVRAEFDEEDGGYLEVTLSGPLTDVQRSIAYLHTTGLHVNPRQRSVTDFSNL